MEALAVVTFSRTVHVPASQVRLASGVHSFIRARLSLLFCAGVVIAVVPAVPLGEATRVELAFVLTPEQRPAVLAILSAQPPAVSVCWMLTATTGSPPRRHRA